MVVAMRHRFVLFIAGRLPVARPAGERTIWVHDEVIQLHGGPAKEIGVIPEDLSSGEQCETCQGIAAGPRHTGQWSVCHQTTAAAAYLQHLNVFQKCVIQQRVVV